MGAQCAQCFGKNKGADPYADLADSKKEGSPKKHTDSIISEKDKISDFNQTGDDVKKLTEK